MIKAVIFDYFGVISSAGFWQSFKRVQYDTYLNLSDKVNLGEIHWQQFVEEIASRAQTETADIERMFSKEKIDQRIILLAKDLKKTGYKTAILTNANHEYVRPIYDRLGFNEIFNEIFISSEAGFIKPDPNIYQYALDKLKVNAKEAVFIDDSPGNTDSARNLGINTVMFKDYDQLIIDLKQLL